MAANPSVLVRVAATTAELKKNLSEMRDQIEVTTAGMAKLAKSLDGRGLQQQAHNIVAAIQSIGGVSNLTAQEAAKQLATLDKYIEKGKLMGHVIPAGMLQTRDALAAVTAETTKSAAAAAKAADDQKKLARAAEESKAALRGMVENLKGGNVAREAGLIVEAVREIGGASKLTAGEAKQLQGTLDAYIEKAKVMGDTVPPAMKETRDALAAVAAEGQKQQSWLSGSVQRIKEYAAGFVVGKLTLDGFVSAGKAVISFLQDCVSEFLEADKAQRQLTAALRAQNLATPEIIEQYDQLASRYERLTVNSADAVKAAQLVLTTVGRVLPSEMDRALQATTDLAAGLAIDLDSAAKMVARSFEDQFGALKKAGVQIDETKAKAQGMTYVLDQIRARFSGQARAELDSYTGKLKQLENQWDNLKEEIGRQLVVSGQASLGIAALRVALDLLMLKLVETTAWMQHAPSLSDLATKPFESISKWVAMTNMEMGTFLANMKKMRQEASGLVDVKAPHPGGQTGLSLVASHGAVSAAETAEVIRRLKAERDQINQDLAAAAAERVKSVREELFQTAAIQKWKDMLVVVKGVDGAMRQTVDVQGALHAGVTAAIEAYRRLGRQVPADWLLIEQATKSATQAARQAREEVESLARAQALAGDVARVSAAAFEADQAAMAEHAKDAARLGQTIMFLPKAMIELGKITLDTGAKARADLRKTMTEAEALNTRFGVASTLLRAIGQQARGTFGIVVNFLGQAVEGVGQWIVQLKMAQTQAQVTAAAVNAAMMVATLGIGAVGQAFAMEAQWQAAYRAQIAEHTEELRELGYTYEDLRAVQRRLQHEAGGIAQGGFQFGKAFDEVRRVGAEQAELFSRLEGALQHFGGKAPQALQPLIAELLKAKNLTEEQRRTLEGMAGAPHWKDLQARAQELGIEFAALGESFNASRIRDIAFGYVRDLTMFKEAGADADGVLRGMADELVALALEAQKTGQALPKQLEGAINRLRELGLFVDQAGNAIGDLSFREMEDESLQAMKDVLVQIRDLLASVLPQAAQQAARGINAAFSAIKPPAGLQPPSFGFGGGVTGSPAPGFASATPIPIAMRIEIQSDTALNLDNELLARRTARKVIEEQRFLRRS